MHLKCFLSLNLGVQLRDQKKSDTLSVLVFKSTHAKFRKIILKSQKKISSFLTGRIDYADLFVNTPRLF